MGSRTAISAGVLAVALSAVPGAAPAAASATATTTLSATNQDCTRDGGLLSGVTNTLCDVVTTVTDTVDSLTGGTTDPVTSGVDKTTDEVLGRVGEAVPTGSATPSKTTEPSATPTKTGLVPESLGDVCLPVLACEDKTVHDKVSPRPTPSPDRTDAPREGDEDSSTKPTGAPTPPVSRPQQMDNGRPVTEQATAGTDEPRVDLLWPNPFAHELTVPMQDRQVVRPTPPASDVLGTVLTIALLGSAVLATRIVQQRRQRTEPVESIPFEPARVGSGRHRLA
ncbi:hypothetical protein ETD86_25330 [Nonomuraea turkmeniaca]|uniref:Secreted protein n=1 Tax=Nonomuraea turkmeniaca TaxID=103838 RepID=A0A5S4FD73_9ACTN|nr:hypothetical protein [Nonomuraea turkmeniaca]TMR16451.1 hypothetical protein ETD86_25330 [Nonomuraea turkmeniaca]